MEYKVDGINGKDYLRIIINTSVDAGLTGIVDGFNNVVPFRVKLNERMIKELHEKIGNALLHQQQYDRFANEDVKQNPFELKG